MTTSAGIRSFQRLIWFGGAFNIVMAAPLIFPGVSAWYFSFFWELNRILGLGGTMPAAPSEGIVALLVNAAGIDLVLIGAIVFHCGFDPNSKRFILMANAAGRALFAAIIVYYTFAFDIVHLMAVIGAIDLALALGFSFFLLKIRHQPGPPVADAQESRSPVQELGRG